jgi:hypothetical protein
MRAPFARDISSELCEDARSGAVLNDADFRGCRWIEGEPQPLRPGMFCGLPVAAGESWCAAHRNVVFRDDWADGPH